MEYVNGKEHLCKCKKFYNHSKWQNGIDNSYFTSGKTT